MANAFQSDAFQSSAFESGGGTVEGSFTAAAVLLAGSGTKTFAADAVLLRNSGTLTKTADAIARREQTGSFTADAFVLGYFLADAWIGAVHVEVQVPADAVLFKSQDGSFAAEAVLLAPAGGTFTAEAVVLATQPASFVADAFVLGYLRADAVLFRTTSVDVPADAVIKRNQTGSFTTDAVLLKTIGGASYQSIVLADSPLHYWRLEETSGTVATDIGSSPVNGTIKSSVTLGVAANTPTPGGTAFSFPGNTSTGYIYASGISVAYAQYSIEAWIKINAGSGGIAGRGFSPGTMLYHSGSTTYFYKNGSQINRTASTGVWHHIVGTFDGTYMRLYVDGAVSGPTAISGTPGNNGIYVWGIGGYNVTSTSTTDAFDGLIDEVAFYSYALSPAQIAAHIAGSGSGPGFTANAVLFKNSGEKTRTANAITKKTISGAAQTFTAEADIQLGFTADAYLVGRSTDRITANAYIIGQATGSFTANACLAGIFSANAVLFRERTGSASTDAVLIETTGTRERTAPADAVFKLSSSASFTAGAWTDLGSGTERTGSFLVDGWVVGTISGFWADAVIVELTRTRSLVANALIVLESYRQSSFTADATTLAPIPGRFTANADISLSRSRFHADAILRRTQAYATVGTELEPIFADATIIPRVATLGSFTADAVALRARSGSFTCNTWIIGETGERIGNFTADAVVGRLSQSGFFSMIASLARTITGQTFTAQAVIPPHFTIDAFIQPYFTADAYFRSEEYVRVFPPGGGTVESFPSRDFAIRVTIDNADITGYVLWNETEFSQAARISPGTFRLSLLGSHSYDGGEIIRVYVDDLLTYGGYVMMVDKTYTRPDVGYQAATEEVKTVLQGADFNILFDKLIAYNKTYALGLGAVHWGPYTPIPAWPRNTMDKAIIQKFCRDYLDVPSELNYTDYVDAVGTANPGSAGAFQSGVSWRIFMSEQSRMTNALWWIDPYMNLHNHDRSTITAPFAITDGDEGISCRDLRVTGDISKMITDQTVWGTLARTVAGETVFKRIQANATMTYDYYTWAASIIQAYIDVYLAIPANDRTARQKAALARDQETLAYNLAQAAYAAEHPDPDYIAMHGRWQAAEFRTDIHTKSHIAARAISIVRRYGKPIIRATATIFEPGFQAGQVVQVKSTQHGLDETLIIRRLTLRIILSRGNNRGLPSYDLEMGLDPEDPWDFYDALPFDMFNLGGFGLGGLAT